MKSSLEVGEDFRTNSLSLVPGGVTVVVTKTNGQILEYKNVKSPKKYLAKMDLTHVLKVQVGTEILYDRYAKSK
jgi:hypothetical protein